MNQTAFSDAVRPDVAVVVIGLGTAPPPGVNGAIVPGAAGFGVAVGVGVGFGFAGGVNAGVGEGVGLGVGV
jgi:hypothetical protein